MEFRLWIGLWSFFFILILVAFNLSFLVKYITRFTEDCFATLVAIIFIIDALKSTMGLRKMENGDSAAKTAIISASLSNVSTPIPSLNASMMKSPPLDPNSLEYQLKKATTDANFFFSCLLFLVTFAICMSLKSFRNKPYLPTKVSI